jgi:hypothetical protein
MKLTEQLKEATNGTMITLDLSELKGRQRVRRITIDKRKCVFSSETEDEISFDIPLTDAEREEGWIEWVK